MNNSANPIFYDHPEQLLKMGLDLIALGKAELAFELARNASTARPNDPLIREIASTIFAKKIPSFHAHMLQDHLRNTAFRKAIEATVHKRHVLDIGTGSGLLAMMAVRAGAAHVYACEANQQLAATARDIIAANGMTNQITVIAKHSTQLDKDRDLGGGADVVLAEIFSADLLSEQALPTLEHARANLCNPSAVIIPQAGALNVALVELKEPGPQLGTVEGFDLALFNRHLPARRLVATNTATLTLRSVGAELFQFDYATHTAAVASNTLQLRSKGGVVNGIVQWLRLDVGRSATHNERYSYENAPGSEDFHHWDMYFYRLPQALVTAPGDVVTVQGWRNDTSLYIWAD